MVLGIDEVLKRVKKEKLIEKLGQRELSNPEGVGIDLRLGAIYKIIAGGAFIEGDPSTLQHVQGRTEQSRSATSSGQVVLGKRKGVKTQLIAQFKQGRRNQEWVTVEPDQYYLVSTLEKINTPKDLMPVVFPRTSLFRAGLLLLNSKTDPGYKGTLTMGLKNLSAYDVRLQMGARICNVVFFKIEGQTSMYRGQHQGGRISPHEEEQQV